MRKTSAAGILAALVVSACAATPVPHVRGGAPFALDSARIDQVRIDRIDVEAAPAVLDRFASYRGQDDVFEDRTDPAWSRDPFTSFDFSSTVETELREELSGCAAGPRPLNAVVLIDELRLDERLRSLADGRGFDVMIGTVELVDPASGAIVARYRIQSGTNSGGLLTRILSDRAANAAEEFGRALCMEAFGRNPRPPAILNGTRG